MRLIERQNAPGGVPLPFLFVARMERSEIRERHPSRTFVPGLRFTPSGLRAQSMIEPKACPTAGSGMTRWCSAERFTIVVTKLGRGSRRENGIALTSPRCAGRGRERSERVRGPVRESEPSGNAPHPNFPRTRGVGGAERAARMILLMKRSAGG